jgi:lactate dehydrogenase-like 2-hydroxyacid dehydrogenase
LSQLRRPRILITRRLPDAVEERLSHRYDLCRNENDLPLGRETLRRALHECDALVPTITDRLDAGLLQAQDLRVRVLANFGGGVEHIDLEAARYAKLRVTNTPGALTEATAQLAVLLMLMAARRAGEGERLLRAGHWTGWAPTQLSGIDLRGKTLGLIGFGRIARETARLARAMLDVRIAYHSRSRATAADEAAFAAVHHDSLASLLGTSDVVSVHCPGGSATRHLLNAQTLRLMRPGAILINTARGSVIDEAALAASLARGAIAAAGLDVYEAEPAVDPTLRTLENVVLLPHLGSATLMTRIGMGMQMADNLDAFFDGQAPPNLVV